MRAFKMHEISAVDRPAQIGARAAILKRDDRTDVYWKRDFSQDQRDHAASTGAALPDGSFPIQNGSDLSNAIHDVGRAQDPAKAKSHIIARAKTLGLTSKLPDGWMSKHERIEDMSPEEIQKAITDGIAAALKAAPPKKPAPKMDDGEPDADDETAKSWQAYVVKAIAKAVTAAKTEMQTAFDKAAEIAKGDEMIVDAEGNELRKSAVGENAFKFMKAQAEKLELEEFGKRAVTEIPHLPGEATLKARVLRAVSKLDKDIKEGLEAMLKGGSAAVKSMTKSSGIHVPDAVISAEAQLETLTKAHMEAHKVDHATAYSKVLETPEGGRLYNDATLAKRAAARSAA